MLDLVVKGGSLIDGTGAAAQRADVGIRAGRVVAVGDVDEDAEHTIDADGRVVAPGFVDIHTHYDAQVLWDPATTPSPLHGITTVVGGNCGFTIAPIEPQDAPYLTRMLARVEGMPIEALEAGVSYDWRTFGEYLDRIEGKLAVNAGFLVGHSAVRCNVMHEDAVGNEATPAQVDEMRRVLGESLAAGGLGFSSSTSITHNDGEGNPVPSRAASRDEIVALAGVCREHPGTTLEFIPSIPPFTDEQAALMTDMSLAANRPLNWNILVPNAARADQAWKTLEACSYAAEHGARVIGLTIPEPMYVHISFRSGFVLDTIQGWEKPMALPPAEKLALLRDPEGRRQLREGAPRGAGFISHWSSYTVIETFAPENAGIEGRTIGDIAAERGQDPFDCMLDIVVADELRTVLLPQVAGEDDESWLLRRDLWRDPRTLVGASDSGAHLDMLSTFTYATRMIRNTIDRDLMPLEEAIHNLTDKPARLYGIRERGRIAPGWYADLVVFDPATIRPRKVEFRNDLPAGAGRLYAEADGIGHVVVNGTEIVRDNELTGEMPGTLLRSGRDTDTVQVPGAASA